MFGRVYIVSAALCGTVNLLVVTVTQHAVRDGYMMQLRYLDIIEFVKININTVKDKSCVGGTRICCSRSVSLTPIELRYNFCNSLGS